MSLHCGVWAGQLGKGDLSAKECETIGQQLAQLLAGKTPKTRLRVVD